MHVVGPWTAVMDCAEDGGGIAAFVFHHIDFTGSGPTAINGILGHKPQSRPITLTLRKFGAEFEASIFTVKEAGTFHAGGSVGKAAEIFLSGDNVQRTTGDEDVLRPAGIVFQFIIAPAAGTVACLEGP